MSEAARRTFACPAASGVVDGVDLALLDRDDEDQRRILIEAEHPELKEALAMAFFVAGEQLSAAAHKRCA